MNLTYNLVDQPFVPVVARDGTLVELGLRDALLRAHELREVRDGSPVTTLALHRLLLAILHRVLGPASFAEWKRLLAAGRFPDGPLLDYLTRWHDRFDLFDAHRPFFQVAGLRTKAPLPAAALFEDLASGNNPTLFDHRTDENPIALSAPVAARGLVARQSFALGLGVSPACEIHGKTVPKSNRQDGPLARGIALLVRGGSLFETLLLNLVRYERPPADLPVWETPDPAPHLDSPTPRGRVDLFTWQSRLIRLEECQADAHGPTVRRVHFVQGRGFDKDHPDPMKPYRRDEKLGWLPLALNSERATWRDSAALFQLSRDDTDRPHEALNWVARAARDGAVDLSRVLALDAFGVGTQKGKATSVRLWRHEAMPLPLGYLGDPLLLGDLTRALDAAEEMARALAVALQQFVRRVREPGEGAGPRPDAEGSSPGRMDPTGGLRVFWSRLELPFQRLLAALAGALPEARSGLLAGWADPTVVGSAREAFQIVTRSFGEGARVWRAETEASLRLERSLRRITKDFKEAPDGSGT